MKRFYFLLCILPLLGMISCTQKQAKEENLVTRRIQYDVTIKTPDPEFDWWVQNIEGEKRETVVNSIMEKVSSGKVKAYDFLTNKPMEKGDIQALFHSADTVQLQRPLPPYEFFDTVIVQNLQAKNISRLRFLEEWRMDKNSLAISKKVLGVCPLIESYYENGELRGYKPLFWVFFDERYPAEFGTGK